MTNLYQKIYDVFCISLQFQKHFYSGTIKKVGISFVHLILGWNFLKYHAISGVEEYQREYQIGRWCFGDRSTLNGSYEQSQQRFLS